MRIMECPACNGSGIQSGESCTRCRGIKRVKFHPAFDTPENVDEVIAVLEAWSNPTCYTFDSQICTVMVEILKNEHH